MLSMPGYQSQKPLRHRHYCVERRPASWDARRLASAWHAASWRAHGCLARTRTSALRPPLDSGWRSKVANPGRRHAPREREGLFDIVRYDYRSGSASGRPRESGDPYPRSLVMGPRALRGRRPGRRSKNEEPTCGCTKWSPAQIHCFRPVIYNGWRNPNG